MKKEAECDPLKDSLLVEKGRKGRTEKRNVDKMEGRVEHGMDGGENIRYIGKELE